MKSRKAAITVNRSLEDVKQLWESGPARPSHILESDAEVTFAAAPGDRGTEIHVELRDTGAGVRRLVGRVTGTMSLAKAKDDLRRFKQHAETGEIPRSEATPEGERFERKLRQRPAQPLGESELQEGGVR